MFLIVTPSGEKKNIKIELFKALDGWEMQHRFIDFAVSTDNAFRRAFTLDVLSYAKVVNGEGDSASEIPLITDAVIDNHLQSWQNVQEVFEEILRLNGIDPKTHADRPNYWADAGAKIAVSFIAEAARLIGPAMSVYNQALKDS